jgi:hypothetical protein
MENIIKNLILPDGNRVLLTDTLAKQKALGAIECARNVYLIHSSEQPIWRVSSDSDHLGDPFTNIIYSDGELRAYRWDGVMYKIDMNSGEASPLYLAK